MMVHTVVGTAAQNLSMCFNDRAKVFFETYTAISLLKTFL